MKHLIILSLLTFSLTSFGQSVALPDSNAIWSVYDQKYFVDGDSTYNSVDYKKYYLSMDSLLTNESLFAIVREDTITRQVFAIASDDTVERLIYDFSLNENDTVSVYPFSFLGFSEAVRIQIESVDTITLGAVERRRQKIVGLDGNTGYDEYWIEGIGSTMGPFNSGATGYVIFDIYYPFLLCFEKDGNLLYNNPEFSSCYQAYPTSVNDIELNNSVDIFPNPTYNSCTIKSESEISTYQVVSVSGRHIYEQRVKADTISVDISDLAEGVYILRLTTAKGLVTKRIIKTAYNNH
jgi:hypothetical protein